MRSWRSWSVIPVSYTHLDVYKRQLEVSSFAKSLGQNIGENILVYKKDSGFTPRMKEDICSILQCAGLIHDIGNPPFGHFGEVEIREWFERNLPCLLYTSRCV